MFDVRVAPPSEEYALVEVGPGADDVRGSAGSTCWVFCSSPIAEALKSRWRIYIEGAV